MLRRTQAGVMIYSDKAGSGQIEIATLRCCHCGGHFVPEPKTKYWCGQCAGHVCSAHCVECVPWEQQLENLEHGRPDLWKPVTVSMSA